MRELERRYTKAPAEIRATDDGKKIAGYAAMFRKESSNLGGFVEDIDPTAFNKSRGDGWPDVMARYNHDNNMLLGTVAAETLALTIDDNGLAYEVTPPTTRADVLELVARGDVQKSSFAFRTIEDDWSQTSQGFPKRTLLRVQLVDVAPVNVPAYPDTTAGLRSLARAMDAPYSDVRDLAERDELRRLFVRTDQPAAPVEPSRTTPQQARVQLLALRTPPHGQA
ncbi:HK97 family phage prohead protease [Streptomyces hygroscopicus subsp. hygroscopicus]|uniref:HK97 family phage prohead protease n=1 Tax=Streptomyces hygroscopicus TaxID=1912 RepID=UPI001C65E1B8|nr:HK97 family phage prohead protease [Streptomyces hygroscopicus]MBW8087761.1 HK97 family phage prohead protease [Streptomyces hygroscopicus subsp. hygroscopicus]